MVKNLVFDMGMVLIRWTPDTIMDQAGISTDDKTLLKKVMFDTPEWVLMDWGKYSEEEMEERVKGLVPERLWASMHQALFHWYDTIVPMPGMKDLLRECKAKGYSLYLLSNASRRLVQHLDKVPGFEYMDGWVVSAPIEMLKPDPAIFHHLCGKYGLKEEECLFVDDLKTNCAGARVAGMDSFVFKENVDELRAYINSLK